MIEKDQLWTKVKQFLHFFLASGFGTSIDFVAFNILLTVGITPVFSNTMSFLVGSAAAFFVILWRNKRFTARMTVGASLAGYVAIGSVSVIASSFVIYLVSESSDSLLIINFAKLMTVGGLFLAKYVLSLFFVFRPASPEKQIS